MMKSAYEMPWFITTAIMGAGFLYLFNLMAKCTAVLGVAVASIASKLSLVLPVVVFLIIDPNDIITGLKALALVLALVAIVLSSLGNDSKHLSHSKWAFILPVIIFTGSGAIDLVFAWFSGPEFIPSTEYAMAFTSVPFTVAFILGAGIWLSQNGFYNKLSKSQPRRIRPIVRQARTYPTRPQLFPLSRRSECLDPQVHS